MDNPITKCKGKYRIASNRLSEWDYGTPGYYFVTVCTQNRVPWFGKVIEDQMVLSPAGRIAALNLERISQIYTNVSIDIRVAIPNHIHAIIEIGEKPGGKVETPHCVVSTDTRKWRSGTLGVILGRYKYACTKAIRGLGYEDFAWQARFYDHIIRNEKELDNIRAYIQGNPSKWMEDKYFSGV